VPVDDRVIRCCTHWDVDDAAVERAVEQVSAAG